MAGVISLLPSRTDLSKLLFSKKERALLGPWVDPTTNLVPSVMLRDLVLGQGEVTWARWLSSTTERLWLSSLLHLPFLLSIPEPLQAVRVAELCLHLGVIWGTYALGCQLAGRGVGLLAAYLLAAVPLMLSWGRAGNADPVIWATLLALFWVLLRLDLRRPRHALQLGLAAGLAASSRLIAMVYLGCAALWVLAFAVRNRRAAINLVPAALLSIILPGWWVAARWGAVSEAARRSTNRLSDPVLQVAQVYLMHGVGYVVLAGLIALAVAWRWGLLPGRLLSLFGFWLLLPVLQLLFMWDAWERYILPLMPMVALIVAVSALRLSERWPAARRRALVATLVLLGGLHLALVQAGVDWVSGLNLPDSRRYAALERVARSVPRVAPVLVMHSVFDDQFAFCLNLRQPPAAASTPCRSRRVCGTCPPGRGPSMSCAFSWTSRRPRPGSGPPSWGSPRLTPRHSTWKIPSPGSRETAAAASGWRPDTGIPMA